MMRVRSRGVGSAVLAATLGVVPSFPAPLLAAPPAARVSTPPKAEAATKTVAQSTKSLQPPKAIMPLTDVRPGMVGEAWTVFSGTKPEPFRVRVVSTVENFIPKQDIILVKAEDPRVEFSGIAAGMIDDAARALGKLYDGAHPGDIGGEAGEERLAAGAQDLGGLGDRRV